MGSAAMERSIEGTSAGAEGGAVSAAGAEAISWAGMTGTSNGIGRSMFPQRFYQSMAAAESPAMKINGGNGPCLDRFI
jgi:hypothetical protein